MTAKLSDEQREALKQHPNEPVIVVDTETQQQYVLLQADLYQKLAPLFTGGEFNPDEWLPEVHEALAEDLNAPGMERYDNYKGDQSAS